MKIFVTVKNVYGKETFYPACDQAKIFAKLVGQATLTKKDLSLIKQLGYTIELYHPEISF